MATPVITPPANNKISFWEILRLWIGGGEYAEHRIPTLLAALLAQGQNESGIVAIIASWLRDNLNDPNKVVVIFYLARVIKYRGGRFGLAIAEALEAMPAVANELQNHPTVRSAPDDTARLAAFGTRVQERFGELYDAAKARIPTDIPNTGGGSMPRFQFPNLPWSTISGGLSAALSGTADIMSSLGGRIAETMDMTIRFFMFWIAIAILYFVFIGFMIFAFPGWLSFIAKLSFLVLIIGSCAAIIAAARRRGGSIVQGAVAAVLGLVFSSMLLVAFDAAAISQDVMMFWMTDAEIAEIGYGSWLMLIGGLTISVIWDRICAGITQKLIAIPGVATKTATALRDGVITQAEQTEIDLSKNITLIDISITVGAVISVFWIPLTMMHMVHLPLPFPLAIFILWIEVALVCAYGRMGAKLHRKDNVQPHLQDSAAKWSSAIYNGSMRVTAWSALVGLLLIGGWTCYTLLGKENPESVGGRVHSAIDHAAIGTVDWAEEQADVTPSSSHRPSGNASQSRKTGGKKSRAALCEEIGGQQTCNERVAAGIRNTFPCPCN